MFEGLDSVNLNLYRVFYYVAKEGSISAAAKKIYVSQPAISKSLKKLEDTLNVELFSRSLSGVKLTDFGKSLLFYVENAYNSIMTAERVLVETNSINKGKVIIGLSSNISYFFISEYLSKFKKDYPNIEVSIISKSTNEMLDLLKKHEIDFIIDTNLSDDSDLSIYKVSTSNQVFVSNKELDVKSIKDLKNEVLILPSNTSFKSSYLNNIVKFDNIDMLIKSSKDGLGISLVPKIFIENDLKKHTLYKLDIKEKVSNIDIDLIYMDEYLSPAPKLFIEKYLKEN